MDEAERKKKSDMLEVEKRIYQIGLMLRRKPVSFIIQYCADTWKIEARQARNYIRKAKADWKEYFEKLKGDGMAYHIAQMRDLKDIAFGEKDTRLVLDITKEEAKLMGIYPAEKHEETRKIIVLGKKEEKEKTDEA